MVPPAGASVPIVAAAGGNGIRPLNADIRLVEVKSIAPLLSTGSEPQPLQVELVEQLVEQLQEEVDTAGIIQRWVLSCP